MTDDDEFNYLLKIYGNSLQYPYNNVNDIPIIDKYQLYMYLKRHHKSVTERNKLCQYTTHTCHVGKKYTYFIDSIYNPNRLIFELYEDGSYQLLSQG